MLDRAFGAGTMIIHVNGTMHPNAPVRPQYMKSSVYVPPIIVRGMPEGEQQRVIGIAQEFLNVIGTRVVMRYQDRAEKSGWQYRSTSGSVVLPNVRQTVLPTSTTSASLIILGYEPDDDVEASNRHSVAIIPQPTPLSQTADRLFEDQHSHLRTSLRAAQDEIARLNRVITELEARVRQYSDMKQEASNRVALSPTRHRHYTPVSPTSVMPSSRHPRAGPSRVTPHPVSSPFDDDQLPAYTGPDLDVPDVIRKYNLSSQVDEIFNIIENVDGGSWKCVLEAIEIEGDAADELTDAMRRATIED